MTALNFWIMVLTLTAVFVLARRMQGAIAGWWALMAAASSGVILQTGTDARIDGFLALFSVLAAIAMLQWLVTRRRDALFLAAMALGVALATKYSALILAAIWLLLPLTIWAVGQLKGALRSRGVDARTRANTLERFNHARWAGAAGFLLLLLAPAGYWYGASWIATGNPIYPHNGGPVVAFDGLASQLLQPASEALAARLLSGGGNQPPAQSNPEAQGEPPTLLHLPDLYLNPSRHGRTPGQTLSPLLLLFAFLPLVSKSPQTLVLAAVGLAGFTAIGAQAYLMRYALPVYPLLAVGAGVVLQRSGALRFGALATSLATIATVLSLVWLMSVQWYVLNDRDFSGWVGGTKDRLTWLAEVGYDGARALPISLLELREDQNLAIDGRSNDTKVLFVGESKIHLIPFPAVADMGRDGRTWLRYLVRAEGSLDDAYRLAWNEGIRFLVFNQAYFQWVRQNIEHQPALALAELSLQRLIDNDLLVPWMEHKGLIWFQLRQPSPQTPTRSPTG